MIAWLQERRCPDCGRGHFLRGPGAGAGLTVECAACGSRWIVSVIDGEVIMAERIAYNGIWPDRGAWE
jgi:DNA-directed RNA polymerase subunit RPC12/RpoP